jgi:hypothetical protein
MAETQSDVVSCSHPYCNSCVHYLPYVFVPVLLKLEKLQLRSGWGGLRSFPFAQLNVDIQHPYRKLSVSFTVLNNAIR